MYQAFLNFLADDLIEKIVNNILIIISIIGSLFIVFRYIYSSFTYDNFDILFNPKAKKQGILHIKSLAKTLFASLLIFSFMLITALLSTTSPLLFIIIFFILCISIISVVFLLIFDTIRIRFNILLSRVTINQLKSRKILYVSSLYLSIGTFIILMTIDLTSSLEPKNYFTLIDDQKVILMFWLFSYALSLLIIFTVKDEVQTPRIKYLFVGTYINRIPCELYLDYIIDNRTYVLSSEDQSYRAIKTISSEDSYSIYLYKKKTQNPTSN